MLKAIKAYLALRRATGFAMLNAEYLLKSFAAFATERGQTHVHTTVPLPQWLARSRKKLRIAAGSHPSGSSPSAAIKWAASRA